MKANLYKTVRLTEAADFLDHMRRPVKSGDRKPGPYPYYGANGQQGTIDGYIFDEPLVLLAEDGGHFFEPNRGIAYKITGKTWVNNHAHVLRPKPGVDIDYLCLVLKHMDVIQHLTGTTRAKLTKAGASRIQISLPPLSEQKRIARILDAADALRAKRRESLTLLDNLTQSIFLDMFGEFKQWPEISIYSLAEPGRGTFSNGPFGSNLLTSELTDSGVPVIYIRDIRDAEYKRVSKVCVTEVKATELDTCQTLPGDVLIAKVGDPPGVSAVYPAGQPLGIITQDVIRIRPNLNIVNSKFLSGYLNSKYGKRKIQEVTVKATRARFGLTDFKSQKIPLPPLTLQNSFASIVESVEKQKARLRTHLSKLDTLFSSLQQRAFNGDL